MDFRETDQIAMTEFDVNTFFTKADPYLRLSHGQRSRAQSGGMQRTQDSFEDANCIFLRADAVPRLRLNGNYALQRCAGGGWLLRSRDSAAPSYWLPAPATLRRVSAQGHILEERTAEWGDFALDSGGVEIAFAAIPEGWTLDAVIWKLDDTALIDELQVLAPVETQGYFLLGSHTRYTLPADLYRHLIHGWVYEDRYAWPHKRRICSENDAHALHLIFSGLERATGKRIYGLLKTQLLLSVLSRQSEDGGFRHGEWTDGMESHYRLHCSAMHLLMDSLAEREDPAVRAALEKAASFIARQTDRTDLGQWFLHDELEHRADTMDKSPFNWIPSKIFGKSESNMLVLNTHLDASIALDRYRQLTGDNQYADLVASACGAAKKVLALRPAEWLYRILFRLIGLALLPTAIAERLPLPTRALKRITWQYLIPKLPAIKTRWPRLVMPGGYVDREVSLMVWAYDYHSVNVMDLLRFLRRFPDEALWEVAESALRYGQESGVREKWLEHSGHRYALGFWAEALYHACLLRSDQRYRIWLADTLLMVDDRSIGAPPSILGANAEAIPDGQQARCPSPLDKRLRLVNLSLGDHFEILVVNPAKEPIALSLDAGWDVPLTWSQAAQPGSASAKEAIVVPARGWVTGIAPRPAAGKLQPQGALCESVS